MIILGLDPGTARVGYGVIKKEKNGIFFRKCGILKILSAHQHDRLMELEAQISRMIKKEKPELVAIEKLYFVKNQKTGMAVSEARGLLTFAALKHKIPLLEFTPLEVKRGLTGYGLANKKAIERSVMRILKIEKIPGGDDAADALAIAILASGSVYAKHELLTNSFKGRPYT